MAGQENPAASEKWLRWVAEIWAAIKSLRRDVRELQTARQTYAQKATVTAYAGGPLCTVTFESGEILVGVGRLASYTPAVNDIVAVLVSPYTTVILGKYA